MDIRDIRPSEVEAARSLLNAAGWKDRVPSPVSLSFTNGSDSFGRKSQWSVLVSKALTPKNELNADTLKNRLEYVHYDAHPPIHCTVDGGCINASRIAWNSATIRG